MHYISTRGHSQKRRFCEILLEGLAPDGGLYLPEHYPGLSSDDLQNLRQAYLTQGYAELAFQILSLYIDDIPANDLRALCQKTYTAQVFGDAAIVPVRKLEADLWIEALSNGPTLAFKDMAMQLLGNLFEYELTRRGEQLNILGATSGDTGSAAEYAMRGKKGVRVFMTSPNGRMSRFQQAQMFSLQDANIHNLAIEGVFDDCQDIVKAVSADLEFKRKYRIGTVNSINWARLLAQVVYYFAGYFQASSNNRQTVSFCVPSGNFGNVCAGHVARMMGLPIAQLVVATNENDVLDEFFRTGVYRVRGSSDTFETSSPSMDISKASNFERFIFDLLQRDAAQTAQLFGRSISVEGYFNISNHPCFEQARQVYGFVSGKSSHADRIKTIKDCYQRLGQTIDPHTADAVKVAREYLQPGVAMIVLETALPIKFADTLVEALGVQPNRPAQFNGIEDLPRRVKIMPASVDLVKQYIADHCPTNAFLTLDQALPQILERAGLLTDTEQVSSFEADGRVLAVPLVSEIQVPGFDNSAMDGYAVRTADTAQPMAQLKVTQRIAAGSRSSEVLRAGQAARIFTGAPIPEGADAVVMQEEVQSLPDDRVSIQTVPSIGQCIRRRGEDIALGQLVLEKGCRLGPAELGLAASIGRAELTVVRKPRVALFSTGDELIMPGSMPPSELPTGAIYNSNRFFLSAMLQRAGCEVTDLGIVPDQRQLTIDAMAQAASHHDLILTSGGVSVGEEDHVKPAVQALGELHLWSLAIKPGKPFALGTVRGINQHQAHFIGLPGNPVSSFVTFLLLARPFLLKMQGVQQLMPRAMKLPANFVWARADRRREFLRARRNQQGSLDLFANQSSGVLTSVTWADGLIDLAAGQTIQAGDWVDFIPFSEWL